jgi:hypothetical protein
MFEVPSSLDSDVDVSVIITMKKNCPHALLDEQYAMKAYGGVEV